MTHQLRCPKCGSTHSFTFWPRIAVQTVYTGGGTVSCEPWQGEPNPDDPIRCNHCQYDTIETPHRRNATVADFETEWHRHHKRQPVEENTQ